MNILTPFDFSCQSFLLIFARFGIEMLLSAILIWLTALIVINVTKNKEQECGFSNHVLFSIMYGVVVACAVINIILILMIRANGLYYFDIEYIAWSFFSGYPLIIPEIIMNVIFIVLYFSISSKIKNSLN